MAGPPTEYKKGDVVEGYQILQPLGTGAASLVYLVLDTKSREIWALKHVHREGHKDLRFVEQAEHEYEVASGLDHGGIRKIPRLIKQRSGLLKLHGIMLVMEFVDGISMEKAPPRSNMELALDLFIQTAECLKHMHERGWVHADMKPNNIMICDGKIAKLIDLGQSCRVNTVKPRIQGTPDYIAPEQVHRRPITVKTDTYNLGATIYWVLTNQFIPTALAKGDSLIDKLDDSLMEKPKAPNSFNPSIPPKLNDLIMKCVEIDPDKRPAMHDVIVQLQIVLGQWRAKNKNQASGAGRSGSGAPINMNGASGGFSGGSAAGIPLGERSGGSSGVGMSAPRNDESSIFGLQVDAPNGNPDDSGHPIPRPLNK
jgi:eukaryotic-like serine/threonine-protein kinase